MSRLRERFGAPTSPAMERYGSSLAVDLRMAAEEIRASRAHARMLGEVGILTRGEADALVEGLERIGEELSGGEYRPGDDLEDIHMAVEARLVELVGEVGERLHTARSRNDQVATAVRLWALARVGEIDGALRALLGRLLDRVEADGAVLMPGYTHLQRGQPIPLGHHLLAHAWAVARDRDRLADARRRLDASPLGACAMAGTSHPIDRRRTAELLGFSAVVENAMDAVAARDHLQELAAVCAIAMTNLSRQAEELVLWSTQEVAFVRLGEAHATGSSIMPQKRNPDAAELARGKTGRVVGDLVALLTLVKGLPLAYNRDLQEDRWSFFDALETTRDSVALVAEVWADLSFAPDRFTAELARDPSLATELADGLVREGVPFREAHGAVARLIRRLEEAGRTLDSVSEEELRAAHSAFPAGAGGWLDPARAVAARTSIGGTAPAEIARQLRSLRASLADGVVS
ncbi:MAG: argininosuccinate lyase [Thermoanaerobaculia bacterium]